ncbi:MAG: GTP-binding protein [Asgard group archaeon]|nr:GTP-binding protein [Asgard group archaeon]
MSIEEKSKALKFDKKGIPLVVIGLAQAGKTSFVQRILTGEFQTTTTTMGLQFETANVGDARFDIFDLGGHISYRKSIWETYVKLAFGIVFVIDSANPDSFNEAKEEFWKSVDQKDTADEFLILFLCNKTDLDDSEDLEMIINHMELFKLAEKVNASYQFFKTSMKTGENIDNALEWLKKNTSKLSAKRVVDPLMFMLADLEGFPLLEIDKLGLKEDPTLLAGFLAAIESFGQRLFGKTGMLQYMVSGDHKYIVKTDEKYIYSMIIAKEECQEEARRQIDILSEVIAGMKEFGILEGIVFQILGVNPSEYVMERGFK